MASRMLRRSGIAVGLVAEAINWRADLVIQVGVGPHHEEVDVLLEEWPDVKFIGYEPHPDSCDDYPGELRQIAITDHEGEAVLMFNKRHKNGATLLSYVGKGAEDCRRITVKTTTLDKQFPSTLPGRVMLWLDCEGSELAVLIGGERFIECVDVVNVEMTANSSLLASGWCSPGAVHTWLVEHGFWLQWIHSERVYLGQVDCVYCKKHLFRPEVCGVPQEIIRYSSC